MKQYQWSFWFVCSVIWCMAHLALAFMSSSDSLDKIMDHWMFVFGTILSSANLLFCIYVGNKTAGE